VPQLFVRAVFSTVSSKFGNFAISLWAPPQSAFAHQRLCGAHCVKPAKIPPCATAFSVPWPPQAPWPRGAAGPAAVRSYRVKDEPFRERIPSSELAGSRE